MAEREMEMREYLRRYDELQRQYEAAREALVRLGRLDYRSYDVRIADLNEDAAILLTDIVHWIREET